MPDDEKIGYEDFFRSSVLALRNTDKSLGIHSVFSGFNQAFREYYDEDPVEITTMLAEQGDIVTRPVKKGVMVYLPEEAPSPGDSAKSIVDKILSKFSEINEE